MRLKKGLIAGLFAGITRALLNLLKYKMFKSYYVIPAPFSFYNLDEDPTQWLIQAGAIDLFIGILFGLLYALLANALPGRGIKKGLGYGLIIWIISEWPSLFMVAMTKVIDWGLIIPWGIAGLISSLLIGVGIVFIYDNVLKQKV